jgi:cyclomaltodextrin glucanotransferase
MSQLSTAGIESATSAARAAAGYQADVQHELDFLFTREIEFRQETIYFIIVDRFFQGGAPNPGPNPELFDPTRTAWGKYWGGDLQGVIEKLDYLKNLGVTALWISPLFEQVEDLMLGQYAAMHGYWTKDFKRINPRFLPQDAPNSLNTCSVVTSLVKAMHDRGMKLILDIVCNHSSPDVNGQKGRLYDDGVLIADYYNDSQNWYYHNPEITDWEDEHQLFYYEMAGLATFNESNIAYRNYIKSAIKQWLDLGVDALRVDTVKHMPLWFWQEFTSDLRTHKPSTFIFGEWGFGKPWEANCVRFTNHSGMSILDFALCEAVRAAIAQHAPGGFHLVQAVLAYDRAYDTATELVTFIDNHDMPRFQSLNGDPAALHLAMVLIMTSRGIPCIYYGTEQYLHNDTNGGNDPYNRPMMERWETDSPLYRMLPQLGKLRRLNPAVSLGSQVEKYITEDVYCYLRRYRDFRCFVALNKGGATTIQVANIDLEDDTYFCPLTRREFEVRNGQLSDLFLNSQEAIVLSYFGNRVEGQTLVRAQLNGYTTQPGEEVVVVGDCPELGNWDIAQAYALEYINDNTWFGEISFNQSAGKAVCYKYAIRRSGGPPTYENLVSRRWILSDRGTVKWRDTWAV